MPWWKLQNNWHNSKSAGNPILFLDYIRYAKEFGAEEKQIETAKRELEILKKFICTPQYAKQIGVMLKTPAGKYPFANHSIQSWAGCAVAATGFCGIALADMIKENIIYLKNTTPNS